MEEFRIVLADACKIVKGSSRKHVISGADEDGRVMVEFSEPVSGRVVKSLTPEEINGMLYKEETAENPADMTEENPTGEQDTEQERGTTEESAFERIPKDAQTGEPQYTQTDADTAWDAIVEQTEGDKDMARYVAESTMKAKEEALKKLESSEPKTGATVTETIAAAKEHKAAIEAARQELEQWKAIVEVENSRKAEAEAKAKAEEEEAKAKAKAEEEEKTDESAERYPVGLDEEESSALMERMEAEAAEIPLIELNPANWVKEFGEKGIVSTPIGEVKMGENQIAKLFEKGRSNQFGMIRPTLETPQLIIEVPSFAADGNSERGSSLLFVKTFTDSKGRKIYYFKSVTVKKDGLEVSVSSHYDRPKRIKEALKKGKLLYRFDGGAQTEQRPADVSVATSREVSQGTSPAGKVSESSETKQEKAEKSISAKVKEASADVNTEPTEAQKEAGNYKKGHVQVGAFDITIEQPEGSIRRGTDANGKQWESKMHNTYGYFRGTEGVDGDHIDVFLSNDMDGWNGAQVFVVDQYNPDGTFDEHKVMLGFNDASDAKNNYLANYEKGWEKGRRIDVSAVNLEDFEKWIASSHRKTKPFSEYKSVKPVDDSETFNGHKVENSGKDIEVQIKHLEEIKDYPGADKKIVQSEIDRLKAEKEAMAKSKNVQGTNKTGAFGTIYTQFKGKAKEAIAFLLEKKEGEAVGALHHKDIGDIDLVWGTEGTGKSDGFGLAKLVKYHPEVLDDLQEILDDMTVVKKNANRVQLESKTHKASVRLAWDEEKKNWLLTAYEKKNSASDNTTDTAETAMSGKRNDTATPQNTVSMGKVSESPETKQEKKEKSEEPKSEEENGVDDAKIDTVLEALDKGKEKAARRLASKLTNKELSKARSKAKPSFLLEYEWQWRAQNRGDVSLHDWMLENQYVEPVKRVSGTFRITDYTASKDSPYAERLGGVYHDKSGFAVATDGRILVASKDDFDPKLKGKVTGKDGTVSESKFPDWQEAIPPAKETKSSNIDVEDLRKFVAGVLRANKRAYISLRFPDGTVEVFKANRLNLMLRAMKQLGTSELLYTKDGMKLVAKSEKGTALLMGLAFVEDELVEANGYAYPGNTVLYHRGEVVSEMSQEERVLRDAVIDRLRESGMEVITDEEAGQRVLDEANGKAKLSAKKRRALETASLGKTPRSLTVVSSADGANVLKSIDTLVSEFERSAVQPKTFIGDVAKALGAKRGGSASEYASFETKNGKIITIRLSNHNAKVSNFDANGETDGISIVVSPKKSEGMTNDGKAHVVEYYYDAIKLRRAEGKPLADIVRSIKQALYSGEFEDTTGLAERQEVNAEITDRVRFFRTAKGEAYGFTVGGKIYIDPKIANTETPIHEYAHLWAAALRGQNPKEWQNIVELMKGTSVWDEVKKRYPELNTDDDIADEVLATYSGRRGAERLREEQRKIAGDKGGVFEKAEAISALERVKQALRKFWKSVADFLHIHYKTAEEVADRVMKDLLDGVDPRKHFNSRMDDPRFMFAGEKGAARADREEEALTRQNNLDVAQKMEAAKKEAKAIKLATGWERGADGKWRYEIPDGIYHPKGDAELKKALAKQPWREELNGLSDRILDGEGLSKEETERFNELAEKEATFKADYLKKEKPHLADWLENDELFKAYPELKRVGIVFTDNMPKEQAGYYDSKSNTITVNTNSSEDTASIIAHEVQHAIQRYEGFATGGNLKAAMEYLSGNKRADVKIKQQLAYKLSQEKGLGLSEEEVNSLIGHLEYEDISDDELQKQIDALCQKHNITEDQLEDIYPMDSVWHEAYNRISGEAEARNVQKRMGMTAEERRASLAADTEDVARDSQILLFDDTGKNMRMESRDTDKEEVNIVEATHEHGFKNYADAKQWAKENIAGTYTDAETDGKGEIRISNTAIDKFLSESATAKSENRDAHMSTLRVLPDVIRESIDAEQHPDFKKGVDGKRSAENGVNSDVMIHRLYGAIRIGDDIYRVKVTLKENRRTKETTKAYSYETTKIELLAGQHGDVTMTSPRNSNNSISVANLLKDVEKSDGGGKILSEDNSEENKIIAEAKKNGRYMLAPNGKKSNLNERQWAQVRTKAFKNWFGDWESDPENSSKVVDENREPLVVDGLFLNLKESPLPKMKKAFLRAKELAEMGRKAEKDSGYQRNSTSFAYSEEGDAFLEEYMHSSDSVQALCDCLMDGYTPKPVVAFRYGEIRENQRSYNYRDNILEKGVSVVGKVSEMNTKKSWYYDAFFGGSDYNIVIGYDINESGADGEMLLTKANVIGKAKDMARIVKSATENSGKFSNEEDDIRYRTGEKKELRDGRKIEFVRKPTATYNALARHLQAEGIKPDMHEARTGSRYMSFEKDGVQWEVRSSDHTKPEYYGETQKPVELTYYKDKQGEENLSVSVDLGTSGYNIEDMKALMVEIDRLKNDAGEVKESFYRGVASDEVMERYPLLSQALGVKSENEVRAKEEAREHAEEARKHAEEARKQEMRSAVEDMAGKLHLNNVDIVDKPAERGAGRRERAKGMFERSTGRITINIGNCADKRDAVVTLLHEAVAHHGLRKLFGENFETFLDNVYNSANAEIRRIIDKHSRRYGGDKRTATEEYMASLSERTDFENAKKSGWWQRIKDFFLKMLEKIGLKGFKGEDLSDNELRYVLWRSYENLKSGGKDTVFSAADDLAKQSELKVGEFAPDAKKTAREENAEEVNERFNNELTRYQSGDMDKNEMLHLGKPQGVMKQFLPDLPIVVRQRILKKGSEKKHNIDVAALANMPRHLSSPIFVFQRSDNALGVLTEMPDRDGKNVCVAIELGREIQNGGEMLEVNDIRSVHGRNVADIVYPIVQNGTLKWADKEKGLAYLSSASRYVQQEIDRPDLSTAAKVVENFENPKPESENDALFRDGAAKDYEKAQARETYERRVSTGMFQSREAIQDSMLSLKVAMDAIEEATAGNAKRIEDYDGFENAYLGENRLSSVNQAESAAFAHLLIRPMMEEVNRLAPTAKDRAELIDYMFAKHGLERNAYMRQQAAEKKLAEYKKQNPGTAKTAADFIDAERDYAGLTTLTGEADVSAAEAEAQRMVADYEKDYTFHGIWNEIYVCRKKIC